MGSTELNKDYKQTESGIKALCFPVANLLKTGELPLSTYQ